MAKKKSAKKAEKEPMKKAAPKSAAAKSAPPKSAGKGAKTRSSRPARRGPEELHALQRLDPLTKSYQTAGLSAEQARKRALKELGIKE
jgi:hypothetical protein